MKDKGIAVLTTVAVVLALLALDDITTDTATSLTFERLALAGCAVWCVIVACRLVWQGRRGLGAISLGVIALCAWAQPAIGPDTAPGQVEYLVTIGGVASVRRSRRGSSPGSPGRPDASHQGRRAPAS